MEIDQSSFGLRCASVDADKVPYGLVYTVYIIMVFLCVSTAAGSHLITFTQDMKLYCMFTV